MGKQVEVRTANADIKLSERMPERHPEALYSVSGDSFGNIALLSKSEEGHGCPRSFLKNGRVQFNFEILDGGDLKLRDLFSNGFDLWSLPRFVTLGSPTDLTLGVSDEGVALEFVSIYRPDGFKKSKHALQAQDFTVRISFSNQESEVAAVNCAILLIYGPNQTELPTDLTRLNGQGPFVHAAAAIVGELGPKLLEKQWVQQGLADNLTRLRDQFDRLLTSLNRILLAQS